MTWVLYLTADQVLAINEREVGPQLLADRHLLESAVAQPSQSAFGEDAYPTIHLKAAALLRSLAANHPFIEGNKRTALVATIVFYNLNGYEFRMDYTELLHLVVDVITDHYDVPKIAERLAEAAVEIPDSAVSDDADA